MIDHGFPGGARRDGRVGGHDLEVDGVVGIGDDDEVVVPVVDAILHAFATRFDADRCRRRIGRRHQPGLRGFVVAQCNLDKGIRAHHADVQEIAAVGFFINQDVRAPAGGAAEDFGRAGIFIAPYPEQPLIIRREQEAAVAFLDRFAQQLAGGQVLDVEREIFRALRVFRPGIKRVVIAVADIAGLIEFVRFRTGVLVEQNLFLGARVVDRRQGRGESRAARAARPDGMLPTYVKTTVILPGAVGRWRRCVIFLDAPLHLFEEGLLQRFGGR